MALEQKLHLKLSQKLIMTPSLQQAIKLLQLSKLELQEVLNQELLENPLLEETAEEAKAAARDGVACIVDGGHADMGRDLEFLKQLTTQSGLPIVASVLPASGGNDVLSDAVLPPPAQAVSPVACWGCSTALRSAWRVALATASR